MNTAMPNPVDIYKIGAAPLSEVETDMSVQPVSPVMGATLTAREYFDHVAANYRDNGELLAPGEIGCTLSHVSIYRKIVARGQAGLILEEDITPTRGQLAAALAFAAQTDLPFVHLGWLRRRPAAYIFWGGMMRAPQPSALTPHKAFSAPLPIWWPLLRRRTSWRSMAKRCERRIIGAYFLMMRPSLPTSAPSSNTPWRAVNWMQSAARCCLGNPA